MPADPTAVALTAIVLLVVGAATAAFGGFRVGVLAPAMTALVLRATYGLASFNLAGLGGDAIGYDSDAQEIAAHWAGQGPAAAELVIGKEGWPYLLATVYALVGHAPEVGILINAIAGALTVVVVAAICRALEWHRATRPAAWIQALWPVAFLWGPLLLREAIVTLLLSLSIYGTVLVGTRRLAPGLALVIASGLAMIWMRGGLAFLILIGLPLTLAAALAVSRPTASNLLTGVAVASASLALAWPALSSTLAAGRYFDEDRSQAVARALDKGSTGFGEAGVAATNPAVAFLNVALGPFPSSWGNVGLLAAGIDAVLWVCLWLLALYGYRRLDVNRWGAIVCVVPLIALLMYLSLAATNFGLIMRMRALGLPFIAPLAGLGLAMFVSAHRRRRPAAMRRLPAKPASSGRAVSTAHTSPGPQGQRAYE